VVYRLFLVLFLAGYDHFVDDGDVVVFEEYVFGAYEVDVYGFEFLCFDGIGGCVGIGVHGGGCLFLCSVEDFLEFV